MVVDVKRLFTKKITEEILNRHKVKTFYSGKQKQLGDKFLLGMLVVDQINDVEIIVDICEKDIDDGIYDYTHLKVNGKDRLAYFKLKNTNDFIDNQIKELLELSNTEKELEVLKGKIDQEIEIRNLDKDDY